LLHGNTKDLLLRNVYCFLSVAIPAISHTKRHLKEIFRDDFNEQSIDDKKWTVYSFPSSNGIYHAASDDVWQENGFMFIRSQKRKYGARNFTSGYVDTQTKFKFLYGQVELRAKFAKGLSMHSHFVLYSGKNSEIMIMTLGDYENMIEPMSHYQSELHTAEISSQRIFGPEDYFGDFHTFKVIWRPDKIIWLVDGSEVWNISDSQQIPQQEASLIVYLNIEEPLTNTIAKSNPVSTTMVIDYITVHQ
jgi:beta-glucanase (GH16 family)